MTPSIHLPLAVVLVLAGSFLHAQDAEKERTKGHVLILKNGNVMEGDVEKVGGQYCLRKGKSEVWIAADKITQLCADWEDAYTYAQRFIKADSAADRVRLARWCQLHKLHDKSLLEARIALNLDPSNTDAKQIITLLERELDVSGKPSPVKPAPAIKQEPAKALPFVDVTTDTLIGFQSRVQPILFNACITCHASGHGGRLHLDRASTTRQQAAAQHNLAAIMPYIDFDRPALSPLLLKAITAHGDSPHAPIKNRDAKPFEAIQHWIEQMIARNPHLKDQRDATRPAVASKVANTSNFAVNAAGTPTAGGARPGLGRLDSNLRTPTPQPVAGIRSAPTPTDAYDGEHFNQRFHPKR